MPSASHTPHNIDWRLSVSALVMYGALVLLALVGLVRLIVTSRRRYWKLERSSLSASSSSSVSATASERQALIGGGSSPRRSLLSASASASSATATTVIAAPGDARRTQLAAKRAARDSDAFRTQKLFHYALILFLCFRLAWFGVGLYDMNLEDSRPDLLEFVLNRGALCTFFTAFTIVFVYWVHSFHSLYFEEGGSGAISALTWFVGLTNVAIYVFQSTVVGIYLYRHIAWRLQPVEQDDLYIASMIVAGASDLLASVGFLVYGVRLFTIGKEHADELSPATRRQRLTTLLATLVFCSCFTLRFALFLWIPASSESVSADLFMSLAYIVPEVIPSLLQLLIVQERRSKTERDARFISDLYAEHDEVRRFEAVQDDAPITVSPNSFGSFRDIKTLR
jgi:hypothetical protein